VKSKIIEALSSGFTWIAAEIIEKFKLPDADNSEAIKLGLIEALSAGLFEEARNIKEEFNLTTEQVKDPEVQIAVKKGLVKVSQYAPETIEKMIEAFKS
jgi:hypothetical protein